MTEERIIVGEGTEWPLDGLLTLPDGCARPVPAVVMVHGSGPSNMDEKVGGCTPFRDLAEGLAARGIASLRYNKRTFSHGKKMVKGGDITVKEETIDDALLATKLLRQDPRVDGEKVFLLGHSMGAMLAPRIDGEGGDYCGLVLMAGTPRGLEEVMMDQNRAVLDSVRGITRFIVKKQVARLEKTFAELPNLTDQEAKARKFAGGTNLYYFREMGKHPASGYLEKLDKPVLVMQGGKDFQVSAENDYNLYKEILAGNPRAAFRLYENLNHAFVPAVYTDIMKARQEYKEERHISDAVLDDIADWIVSC